MPETPVLARAALHFWEEPSISGKNGSGTVFFSGCALHCAFCQNADISTKNKGKQVSVRQLSDIFKNLEDMGAHNINLHCASLKDATHKCNRLSDCKILKQAM